MIILLFGAPGAGKGTQSDILHDRLQMLHISSGDLLRDHRKRNTELGVIAEEYMHLGELVPDDLIIEMIIDRLSAADARNGVLLDGFPRNLAQAEALDEALDESGRRVNAAIYINVAYNVLIDRLSGRLTCKNCGHVFHEKFAPPQKTGVCDTCGGELYQRDDDKRETAIKRLSVFEQTLPIIQYYREKHILCEVSGDQAVGKVTEDVMRCLR